MLNELNFYKKNKGANNLRNSKGLGKKILSLPITEDHTDQEIVYICKKNGGEGAFREVVDIILSNKI